MTGMVFDIKEFSLHDGPGPRTTVFFKGCPLKCSWCHNPEGICPTPQLMIKHTLCTNCGRCMLPCTHEDCKSFLRCVHACPNGLIEICGTEMTDAALATQLMKHADFYAAAGGGITFSGGEPLMQSDFLLAVTERLNCHTAIQTSGYASEEVFLKVIEKMDFVMMDIKIANRDLHKRYTGVYNDAILNNFRLLQKSGKPYIIRTPLIKGICDTQENLCEIRKIIGDAPWELLDENPLRAAKYAMLENK